MWIGGVAARVVLGLAACGSAPAAPSVGPSGPPEARHHGGGVPSDEAEPGAGSKDVVVVAAPVTDLPDEADNADVAGVVGTVKASADGDREVFVRRQAAGPLTELVVTEKVGTERVETVRLGGSTCPDRPAIDASGERIAFVSGVSGVSSVWVMPFDGSLDPVQVTNVGLELVKHALGEAPPGFVPPPVDDSLAFVGEELQWTTADGVVRVSWQ